MKRTKCYKEVTRKNIKSKRKIRERKKRIKWRKKKCLVNPTLNFKRADAISRGKAELNKSQQLPRGGAKEFCFLLVLSGTCFGCWNYSKRALSLPLITYTEINLKHNLRESAIFQYTHKYISYKRVGKVLNSKDNKGLRKKKKTHFWNLVMFLRVG